MTDEDKPAKEERLNKLMVARTNTRGMFIVAAISGLISLSVSLVTFWGVKQKLLVEDSLERAKIFQGLVETVRTSEDPTYALLALWKVFPEDVELIVMTALMNPTPQTVSTLHAFGFAEQLDVYNKNITQMMIHAPRERRQEFSVAYRNVSPKTVLDVLAEAAIRARGDEREMYDLQKLVGFRDDMLHPLLDLIGDDDRVQNDLRLRLRFGRLVYDRDPAPLSNLIATEGADVAMFHQISQELINHLELLTPADQDTMIELSLAALAKIATDASLERKTGDIMDMFAALSILVEPSEMQRQRLTEALISIYKRKSKEGRPDTRILKTINQFSPAGSTASDLYLATLACLPRENLRLFHVIFSAEDLAMQGWDEDLGLEASTQAAKARIGETEKVCSSW